jgi:hypothetical protein
MIARKAIEAIFYNGKVKRTQIGTAKVGQILAD